VPTVDEDLSNNDCSSDGGLSTDGSCSDEGLSTDDGSSANRDDKSGFDDELAVIRTLQLQVLRNQQKRRRLVTAILPTRYVSLQQIHGQSSL
jgi:hypothetical protein